MMSETKPPANPSSITTAPRGRSFISSSVVDKIVDAVRRGNFICNAAKLVGIKEDTLHNWVEKGREYSELGDDAPLPSSGALYVRLFREISEARAELEAALVATVADTALDRGDWRAATWFLERSFHHQWARKSVTTVEGSETNPVKVQVSWAEGLRAALEAPEDDQDEVVAEVVGGGESPAEGE